ncbi:MAG: hypothetical protein IJ960_03030 [Oscillospiraceae bacterium]|nr:hypothetical protein [Oscillospiraceae bacterium]
MKVNMFEHTIVLTKKEMTAASHYGSDVYKELQNARRDYPGYEVVIVTRTVKTQRETYKGLTYEYMEKYIKAHDDEEKSIWTEYMLLRGTPINPADELPVAYTYSQMKVWFLNTYKDIAEFYKNIA